MNKIDKSLGSLHDLAMQLQSEVRAFEDSVLYKDSLKTAKRCRKLNTIMYLLHGAQLDLEREWNRQDCSITLSLVGE